MKKFALSGVLSSFSNSWQHVSGLSPDRNELLVREICRERGAGGRQMLWMAEGLEAVKQL